MHSKGPDYIKLLGPYFLTLNGPMFHGFRLVQKDGSFATKLKFPSLTAYEGAAAMEVAGRALGNEIEEEGRNQGLKLEEYKQQEERVGDETVLRFLDSTDSYLILLDSLTSTLRQGWLELASARHSMGGFRMSTAMLDLKLHSAATSLLVTEDQADSKEKEPHFILRKWASLDNGKCCSAELTSEEDKLQEQSANQELRHRGKPQLPEEKTGMDGTTVNVDDQIQKDRLKSLSMFGTLVPPKLRAAQLSFETALETIVEIANIRSSMLSSFDQVNRELESRKE